MDATTGLDGRRLGLAVGVVSLGVVAVAAAWTAWTVRDLVGAADGPTGEAVSAGVEGCVACHGPLDDPGGAHAGPTVGCATCHLGDPRATDEATAHAGMELEPGALDTVVRTCGTCHAREVERVRSSLMTTARGLIAVDKWAFGEQPVPDGEQTMGELLAAAHHTPAESHVDRLCAGCHLGTRRDNRDDAVQGTGSGCGACHSAQHAGKGEKHPPIEAAPPDRQCLGCHSRSARISLSYQGLAEISEADVAGCPDPTRLHDGRPGCRLEADVHHVAGIGCVDCHVHTELMGDGVSRAHEEQQLEVGCETCHGPVGEGEEVRWADVADPITRDLLRMRGEERPDHEPARVGRRGTPLWNLRPDGDGGWRLHAKAGGRDWPVKQTPTDDAHAQPGHERMACSTCHSAWMPMCTSCHTTFDPEGEQWSFAAGAVRPGAWVERNDGMGFGDSALGVRADGTVMPAMPGMIADLDARAAGGPRRATRLFSMVTPHTTGKQARPCAGCHRSAVALGLGAGALDIDGDTLAFRPAHPLPDRPELARDGWVTLLPERPGGSTRTGSRSLDAAAQRRVLRVGACLRCHAGDEPLWRDLDGAMQRLASGGTSCEGRVLDWMSEPASGEPETFR